MNIGSSFEIFGITIHLYGLIIGLAIIGASTLIEKRYKKLGYPEDCFWKIGLVSLIFEEFLYVFLEDDGAGPLLAGQAKGRPWRETVFTRHD